MDIDEIGAHATILALRASVEMAPPAEGEFYRILPSTTRLNAQTVAAALRSMPKRVLCSATSDGHVMTIRCEQPKRIPLTADQIRLADRRGNLAVDIRNRLAIPDEEPAVLLTSRHGTDTTLLLSIAQLYRWLEDYSVVGSKAWFEPTDEQRKLGASAVVSLGGGGRIFGVRRLS